MHRETLSIHSLYNYRYAHLLTWCDELLIADLIPLRHAMLQLGTRIFQDTMSASYLSRLCAEHIAAIIIVESAALTLLGTTQTASSVHFYS